ncbi:hypothetical protein CBG25_08290 [Arsenophonus sp. ENCA]|nr:hypothetical protein CBG25_08290 [Arsenophonus sp. ENCA]
MDNRTKYEHPYFFLFLNLYFFFRDCETRDNDEIVKITRLRKRKITEKGLMYHFDVEGGNGSLIGESGKRIFVIN